MLEVHILPLNGRRQGNIGNQIALRLRDLGIDVDLGIHEHQNMSRSLPPEALQVI